MAKNECQQQPITGGKNDEPRTAQMDFYWASSGSNESVRIPERGGWSQGAHAGVFVTEIDPLTWHPANQNPVEPIRAMRSMPLL